MYLLLQMGGWPLAPDFNDFSLNSLTAFRSQVAEVRGCHRSNPLEANVWESQVISRFGSWESSTGWFRLGNHFLTFETLVFLMVTILVFGEVLIIWHF